MKKHKIINRFKTAFVNTYKQRRTNNIIKKQYFSSLNKYADYPMGCEGTQYLFTQSQVLSDVFAKYALQDIAGSGSTLSRARNIMQWVADHSRYDGGSPLGPSLPDKILEYGFEQNNPINCTNRAVLFSDALISLGIFAMPMFLNHFVSERGETHCHTIAQVWLPEFNSWCAFDPSFNTYFLYNNKPIDVPSMALLLRKNKSFQAISNETGKSTRNGTLCTKIGLMDIFILPGNDFRYRYHWDEMLHFIPESYLTEKQITAKIVGFSMINKKPVWQSNS